MGAVGERDRQRAALLDEQDRDAARRGSGPSVSNSVSTTSARARATARRAAARPGRAISARAIASCCCWPPDSEPAWRLGELGDDREEAAHPVDDRRRRPPCVRRPARPEPQVLVDGQRRRRCAGPRARARRRRARRPPGAPRSGAPVEQDLAAPRAARRRMIACSVVDLPAPFGPIRPTISPGSSCRLEAAHGGHGAVAHVDRPQLQDGQAQASAASTVDVPAPR